VKCAKCEAAIQEGEEFSYCGQILCEDCYIRVLNPPKACDVAAVQAAKSHRAKAGLTGTEGLTELQKDIVNYVKERGKVTRAELLEHFGISEGEGDRLFAVLRHCEVLKGRKEGTVIYVVPWDA
jgi:uncharacterized membrane protein